MFKTLRDLADNGTQVLVLLAYENKLQIQTDLSHVLINTHAHLSHVELPDQPDNSFQLPQSYSDFRAKISRKPTKEMKLFAECVQNPHRIDSMAHTFPTKIINFMCKLYRRASLE